MVSPQGSVNRARRALVGLTVATLVGVAVLVFAAATWFRESVYGAPALPLARTDVVIERGASFADVVATLSARRVLAHPLAFRILARLRHVDADIKAGEYRFPARQTTDEVLNRLVRGEQFALWVTIPEGYTASQIAATLAGRGLGDAAAFERVFRTQTIEIGGVRTRSLEGYLFPSTYLIPTDDGPPATARVLVDQFRKQLPPDAAARAKALGRTLPEVVTIASIVEREGKLDADRPLIASVIYNRLRLGMPLEVDASIEYVFPEHHDVITKRDLQIDSPYNTYLHAGLPPTPIANPGQPSIDAALRPAHSDYLYYIAKSDGHSVFARTLSEHNANVARYLK